MTNALEITGLTPAEKLVLVAISSEPTASPARLECITAMEPAVIARALRVLSKRGLLGTRSKCH